MYIKFSKILFIIAFIIISIGSLHQLYYYYMYKNEANSVHAEIISKATIGSGGGYRYELELKGKGEGKIKKLDTKTPLNKGQTLKVYVLENRVWVLLDFNYYKNSFIFLVVLSFIVLSYILLLFKYPDEINELKKSISGSFGT